MINSKPRLYFLLVLLFATSVLAFFILKPFLYALILAIVFAIVCQPLYQAILKAFKGRAGLASLVTILFICIFVFAPLFLIGWQIFGEGQQLYFSLSEGFGNGGLSQVSVLLEEKFNGLSPLLDNISLDFGQYFKTGLNWLLNNLGAIFLNFAQIMTSSFVFLFAFYYLLRDGEKIKQFVIKISPLNKEDDELIVDKVSLAINAVVKGSLMLAVIQGILLAIGLYIFNVPNPVLWGTVAAIGALIPMVGTAIIVVPAVIWLYFSGQIISALGLLLWGVLFVGLIDNLLRPHLVGKGASLHPLLILLSVLGGLSFFGPVGFVLGPLVATLFVVLIDICSTFIVKNTC
jgi:predicted PurR-regulated permease PerM